jgi:hypothetical protein
VGRRLAELENRSGGLGAEGVHFVWARRIISPRATDGSYQRTTFCITRPCFAHCQGLHLDAGLLGARLWHLTLHGGLHTSLFGLVLSRH